MKLFKRVSGNESNAITKINVINLENNKLQIDLDIAKKPTSFITSLNDVFLDKNVKLKTGSHIVIVASVNKEKNKLEFFDILRYTNAAKASTRLIKNSLSVEPVFYIFIPYADSNISEWTLVAYSDELLYNNEQITDEIDLDQTGGIDIAVNQLLPGITLSKSGNEITAQLTDAKANVEIYFETTAGYLNKTRALTDATGKATVKVFGDELEGKVKAGFKYFSGKAEVNI